MADKKTEKKGPKEVQVQVNQISLLVPYAGVPSNHQTIHAGVYRENDPSLLGLGEYLVSTRHARVIGKIDPYPEVDEAAEDEELLDPEPTVPPPNEKTLLEPPV